MLCWVLAGVLALGEAVNYDEELNGVVRRHYIQAEEVVWDYAPSGKNLMTDVPLEDDAAAAVFTVHTSKYIGRKYKKAVYVEYTDETFTEVVKKPEWLGFYGPLIRAEVGDVLEVTFRNNASHEFTMHPHGVRYNENNEGAGRPDSKSKGAGVPPRQTFTYRWEVPVRAGPAEADGRAVMWLYHSHHDSVPDEYSGLIGPLVVYERGTLNSKGRPMDVDHEFVLVTSVTDENQSWYIDESCKMFGCDESDAGFEESNLMHGINGFVYGNLPGLNITVGNTVRWFVMALGTEVDLHTVHWHGETVVHDGHRVDVVPLLPAVSQVAMMDPDQQGTFPLHCHVNDHILAGMSAWYTISPASAGGSQAGRRRRRLRG